jgi:Fur family ferric uptake transcriptional regulator
MSSDFKKDVPAEEAGTASGLPLVPFAGTGNLSIAEYQAHAEELLRGTGERVTRGRVVVLASLLEAKRALTHGEVESRIERLYEIDRVTVYRVLDWLTQQGLTHRLAGDDRVWRFTAAHEPHARGSGAHPHPHFKCNTCGDVICLDEVSTTPRVVLPAGYKSEELEVTVKGQCAMCAPRKAGPGRKAKAVTRNARRRADVANPRGPR